MWHPGNSTAGGNSTDPYGAGRLLQDAATDDPYGYYYYYDYTDAQKGALTKMHALETAAAALEMLASIGWA